MAETLSIAGSIVSITAVAMHGMRLLHDDLQKIKEAPKTIEKLRDDILFAEKAVILLQAVKDIEWESLGGTVADTTKTVVASCGKACEAFRADLQSWTSHSGDGHLSKRDRVNVGFFKQRRIESMSKQLQNCIISINAMTGMATL